MSYKYNNFMALIPVDITENKSIMDIVHTKLLEMLDFIIDICKKENINFYLSYGSALGAYREAKIIPHDDDIDLDMNIDDFIKFISVINKYNNPKFEFKYFGNQPHEKMIWCVLCYKNSIYSKKFNYITGTHGHIAIDIFPLVKTLNNNKVLEYQKKILFNQDDWVDWNLSEADLFNSKLWALQMFSGLNTRYVCSIDPNINKYIFKKDTIFPLKEVKFENRILKIPNKIDEYLQILYGNDFNIPKKNKILLYEVVIDGKKYI